MCCGVNCILHYVLSIKDCVTTVVINVVVLGRRFLSLDCFVFVSRMYMY